MKTKKIDTTLQELIIGILVFELLCQFIGIFFVKEDLKYSIGLWIGTILAVISAYHMWWSLNRNLTVNADNESGARAFSIKSNLIRYLIILFVFGLVCVTDFANPIAAFLGIMGLKAGAYLQPLTHKILLQLKRR